MLPLYLILCSHREHCRAVGTQEWQLYTSSYLLRGEGQKVGREMALLIHMAEEPIWTARREEGGESVTFLHALQLVWEATSLLVRTGLCYKLKAAQKPMIFQTLC